MDDDGQQETITEAVLAFFAMMGLLGMMLLLMWVVAG